VNPPGSKEITPTMKWFWTLGLLLLAGPVSAQDTTGIAPSADINDAAPLLGFSWIEEGTLAAMGRPGRKEDLEEDLAFLQNSGIRILISLTEEPVDPEILVRFGMQGIHLPVEDFTPPTLVQIGLFLEALEEARELEVALGMHCTAGMGRTGTMMAAYLVNKGLSPDDALSQIRELRPGSGETPEQEERVAEFARTLKPAPETD